MDILSQLSFSSRKRVPVILQTEAAECGLACIAMISSFHGHITDLNKLRQTHPVTLKGQTAADLVRTSNDLNFSARGVKVALEQLKVLPVPCILHWGMDHFVVLESVSKNSLNIVDPEAGRVKISINEASKLFTGIAIELTPTEKFEKKNDATSISIFQVLGKIHGVKRSALHILCLSSLLQIFALIAPFFMQLTVDNVIISDDKNLLNVMAVGFGLLAFITASTQLLRSFVVMHISNKLNVQIAANVFKHLIHLPLDYFERRHLGDVISRFSSIGKIKELLAKGLVESVVDGLLMITTLILMFIYSKLLASVVLTISIIYLAFRIVIHPRIQSYTEAYLVESAKERTNFMESIRAIQTIKLFSAETTRQSKWHNLFAGATNKEIRANKLKYLYESANTLLFGVENVVVIFIGANLVMDNELSLGMLFAFMAYKLNFTTKTSLIIEKYMEFKLFGLHLNRLADIVTSKREDDIEQISSEPIDASMPLKINNLSFRYSTNEKLLFDRLSHTFQPQKSTAIIGPSGSGKTTLIKIILGLIKPLEGDISLGTTQINSIRPNEYRNKIGTVMQDDSLISGSIMDNITFFSENVDEKKAIECAKIAEIHVDITAFPMGYYSLIGDMGNVHSGGQKLRLLLARALYKEPEILFLDEATSHLDQALEKKINASIQKLDITRIIVAHRQESISAADHVVQLENGQLKVIR